MTKDMVMMDSDGAASRITVTGWVSRHGRYFGDDERAARSDGCTHRRCEGCGEPVPKSYILCNKCRDIKDTSRYESLGIVEWDEEVPLGIWGGGEFLCSPSEVLDYCEDNNVRPEDLKLIVCTPNFARLESDMFAGVLDADGDTPGWLEDAIDKFNEAAEGKVVTWQAGNKRVALSSEDIGYKHE